MMIFQQPNTSATPPQRQSASTSGGLSRNSQQPIRALGKDSNSGPTSDEWSKASTNKVLIGKKTMN